MAKAIVIEADSAEELALEFAKAIASVGNVSYQPPKGGKGLYGKWLSVGGGIGGFSPSISIDAPDFTVQTGQGVKMPTSVNITVVYSKLLTAKERKANEATQAATILADLAALQAKAKRLGVELPAAGEDEAPTEE